jgi:hypothetical protein
MNARSPSLDASGVPIGAGLLHSPSSFCHDRVSNYRETPNPLKRVEWDHREGLRRGDKLKIERASS